MDLEWWIIIQQVNVYKVVLFSILIDMLLRREDIAEEVHGKATSKLSIDR